MNEEYIFTADRQLVFYVTVEGHQRLVRFGERDSFGMSVFQTFRHKTAEAIRRSGLFKRGIIKEVVRETKSEEATGSRDDGRAGSMPNSAGGGMMRGGEYAAHPTGSDGGRVAAPAGKTAETVTGEKGAKIEAKKFTLAKSMLAKKLGVSYGSIKTPEQLQQMAKEAGIELVY